MSTRFAALATLAALAVCTFDPALAQTDSIAMAHTMAANQLGVMEYCQGRGDVGVDAVTAQRSAIARLPASAANNDTDEALGKQGTLMVPNGTNMTLDSIASAHGTTVSAMCKQMGSGALQSASAFRQSAMPPAGMAMPAMPNGMAMPAMPNGMTMPATPAAPAPQ